MREHKFNARGFYVAGSIYIQKRYQVAVESRCGNKGEYNDEKLKVISEDNAIPAVVQLIQNLQWGEDWKSGKTSKIISKDYLDSTPFALNFKTWENCEDVVLLLIYLQNDGFPSSLNFVFKYSQDMKE